MDTYRLVRKGVPHCRYQARRAPISHIFWRAFTTYQGGSHSPSLVIGVDVGELREEEESKTPALPHLSLPLDRRKHISACLRPRAPPSCSPRANLTNHATHCLIGRRTRGHTLLEVAATFTFSLRFWRRSDDLPAATTASLLVSSRRSLLSMWFPFLSDHRRNRRFGSTVVSPASERPSLRDHHPSTPCTLPSRLMPTLAVFVQFPANGVFSSKTKDVPQLLTDG
ncbi:hypothetical protein Salat_1952600 [Sesamum alatum]|uniref:Uncharacterized protein n=1 Tax=Sesamum alatum TaxID=300844 RepID=A0AAE1Y599_9LAMI|nr:hypothetical protein Salat_1952600 [Sesamum alatum]